jgi:hypothetical protein
MKEYKKNMTDKDVIFENRKASLFSTAATTDSTTDKPPSDLENDVVPGTEATAATAATADVDVSEANPPIELSELKTSIEQVDAWSSQKLGLQ